MLQQVRGALKGAVAWFVIILLILAFALFGVPQLGQFGSQAAVKVGSQEFSANYVQNEFNRAMQIRRSESGGRYTREQALAQGLPDQVVNSIATSAALTQLADDMGLVVPTEFVRDFLQENENFQNQATGKFDRFVLEEILRRNGISVDEFESRLKEELTRSQMITALTSSGAASDPFLDLILRRETEQRQIAYLTVTDEMSGVPAEPTPDDLQTYYQQNQAAFTAPEYRRIEALILRESDFTDGLEAPEEELRRLYEANKERLYDKPETRTLYQITYDSEAEAQAAVASLRTGAPFEQLASDRGLTLDTVTFTEAQKRDIVDPAVADAAFAEGLGEGEILDPIDSLFGWTVVQIAGVTPPSTTTFEEVKDALAADYVAQDTRRRLFEAVENVELERDSGADLAAATEALDLELKTFGPIDRYSFAPGGAIIDGVPGEVLAEAFQLDEGEESEAGDLSNDGGYFFVAVKEIMPPALTPFEDVEDEVADRWRKEERVRRITNTVQQIRQMVADGQTLEEAALTFDRAPIEKVIDNKYEDEIISATLLSDIFAADPKELVSGPTAFGDAQVLIEVRDIAFAPGTIDANQRAIYEQYLGYQLEQELVDAFVRLVREDAGVTISRERLDALFATDS